MASPYFVGSYIGDGTTDFSKSISLGTGFGTPIAVFVWKPADLGAYVRIDTLPADKAIKIGPGYNFTATGTYALLPTILRFGTDAFLVANVVADSINASGVTYRYWAIALVAGETATATWAGDDSWPRAITFGFRADFMYYFPAHLAVNNVNSRDNIKTTNSTDATIGTWRDMGGRTGPGDVPWTATGINLKSGPNNVGGNEYHVVACKAVADHLSVVAYTGNNVDDRSITGAGFSADLAFINMTLDQGGGGGDPRYPQMLRFPDYPSGTDSITFENGTVAASLTADCLQVIEADGAQIGANDFVNESSPALTYDLIGIRSAVAAPVPVAMTSSLRRKLRPISVPLGSPLALLETAVAVPVLPPVYATLGRRPHVPWVPLGSPTALLEPVEAPQRRRARRGWPPVNPFAQMALEQRARPPIDHPRHGKPRHGTLSPEGDPDA